MERQDGGPAFPCSDPDESGMTIRDWFAGMALTGIISHGKFMLDGSSFNSTSGPQDIMACIAIEAYLIADEMISEKSSKESTE